MLYMLDTDMASYIIRGRAPQVDAKLSAIEPSALCISVMTRAELLYGLKSCTAVCASSSRSSGRCPRGVEAADLYAEIWHRLATAGQLIDDRGTLIGHSGGSGDQ